MRPSHRHRIILMLRVQGPAQSQRDPPLLARVSLVSPPHVLTVLTHTLKTETHQLIKSRDKSAVSVNVWIHREITVVSDFTRLLRTLRRFFIT